ncbi:MAG TPA: cobalamin-binding protein [Gemmatimonadaceae bacterium]|nr:cobalamin-binding protein [Gemmatimonadaceae bacterium]
MPRVVSFLPAATEIVHALGAGDALVGRSHECDYPAGVASLPVVSKPAIDMSGASPEVIDEAVATRMAAGDSMYLIDEELLRRLTPDVILTQNLCRVCAPSGDELTRAVRKFAHQPEVLFLTPRSVEEIVDNIRSVGAAINRSSRADNLIRNITDRIDRVRSLTRDAEPRRVVFLEWTESLFCAGHWVPEMIEAAGGFDAVGRARGDSVRMSWKDVADANPDTIIVSPCGFGLEQSAIMARALPRLQGTAVYAVDANAYFARPGPRVAEGVELLAHLFHPSLVAWNQPIKPWEQIV